MISSPGVSRSVSIEEGTRNKEKSSIKRKPQRKGAIESRLRGSRRHVVEELMWWWVFFSRDDVCRAPAGWFRVFNLFGPLPSRVPQPHRGQNLIRKSFILPRSTYLFGCSPPRIRFAERTHLALARHRIRYHRPWNPSNQSPGRRASRRTCRGEKARKPERIHSNAAVDSYMYCAWGQSVKVL